MLAGNLVALGTGAIVSVTWSLISPEDFDFDITRSLNYVPESTIVDQEAISSTPVETEGKSPMDEKNDPAARSSSLERDGSGDQPFEGDVPEIDFVGLNAAFKFALYWSLGLFTVLIIVSLREPWFRSRDALKLTRSFRFTCSSSPSLSSDPASSTE